MDDTSSASAGSDNPVVENISEADREFEESEQRLASAVQRKKWTVRLVALAILAVAFYFLALPISPKIQASGDSDYPLVMAERSLLATWLSDKISQDTMCDMVKAWSSASGKSATCTDQLHFSRSTDSDGSDTLWGEMRGVTVGDETETVCFMGGNVWILTSGISILGFNVQTSKTTCTDLRKATHDLHNSTEYIEVEY